LKLNLDSGELGSDEVAPVFGSGRGLKQAIREYLFRWDAVAPVFGSGRGLKRPSAVSGL